MDKLSEYQNLVMTFGMSVGLKIVGAIVLWIVGGWVITGIAKLSGQAMTRGKVDATMISYAIAAIRVSLRILLVIAILSVFGIETTSFAALLAAAGIAIGAAWSGLLANFAAGIFLMLLRPFKVGDMISGGGVIGVVREIGLFSCVVDTPDNVCVTLGNNKILADNIVNYSHNAYRRVDLAAQIAGNVDPKEAIERLRRAVATVANIMTEPAPVIEILEFNPRGALIAVRPFCHNNDYWQVYFDTNKAIAEAMASSGYPAPSERITMVQAG